MNLQLGLDVGRSGDVQVAIHDLAHRVQGEEHGAIFTRPEVVEAILDLAGYTPDRPLSEVRLLEPSFGDGEFLLAAIRRLLASVQSPNADLSQAIRGVELHDATWQSTRGRVIAVLRSHGMSATQAEALAARWLIQDDFLLTELGQQFDVIVGNPPYVRQERIPGALLQEYRRRFTTLYDRADLYVPFFEKSLDLLHPGGRLAFICANRWFKNKYGGPLRAKIARGFHLKYVIDLEGASAFQDEVAAYPAITVIEARLCDAPTRVALHGRRAVEALDTIVPALLAPSPPPSISTAEQLARKDDPWLLDVPQVLPVLRRLEAAYPSMEEASVQVGIGVATGCDEIFIDAFNALPVEAERKLPLVMAGDLVDGRISWSGKGIVNPWQPGGDLVNPRDWPLFRAWIERNEARLRRRHTARAAPERFFRTIDRIYPALTTKPKLLIPDIKGDATVVYDEGSYYPHHNLYVITSDTWDLRALQALLRSSLALMFVAAYCVRMSGGFLRFQAQYLRRIRLPVLSREADRGALAELAEEPDVRRIDLVVARLYHLSPDEAEAVQAFAAASRVRRAP